MSALRGRLGVRRAAVGAVMLVAALLPIRSDLAGRTDWGALGEEAQAQVGWEVHTRRSIAGGQVPLWNPYHFGGRPHLADPGTLALYPPHVLLRFLPIDIFFAVSFVLHAWVFGAGAYLTARRLDAPVLPALLAAVGVMLAGVLLPRPDLAYSPTVYAIAWIPLVVALALKGGQRPGVAPRVALVAVVVMGLTAPSPGPAYTLASVGSCFLFAALWPLRAGSGRRQVLTQLAALLCLCVGLSAFQLLPSARLRAASWTGSAVHAERSGAESPRQSLDPDSPVAGLLTALPGSRTVSECGDALGAGQFLWSGIPGLGGQGGTLSAGYASFASVAGAGRTDLPRLVNAGHVVSCSGADSDRLAIVARVEGATIFRDPHTLPRAFWTCAPSRVGRQELDYWLRHYRYDETLSLREANPAIHVRWGAGVDESARSRAETTLHIRPLRAGEDRTWQYELVDTSRANLVAIVSHPAVEDTAGFERGALTLPPAPPAPAGDEPQSEWLLGADACTEIRPAAVLQMDRADGHFVATVDAPRDGLVFVSETHYPDRSAWVDGTRVEALKVNLAFTGIPVPAGPHRIELRADAAPFWAGAATTALTMIVWALCATWTERR